MESARVGTTRRIFRASVRPMTAATRQICFVNAAHALTHYSLLILATAVLAMTQQEPGVFGTAYGPVLALGTGMFVVYGLGALPMGWLAGRFGRRALMAAFFLGGGRRWRSAGWPARRSRSGCRWR